MSRELGDAYTRDAGEFPCVRVRRVGTLAPPLHVFRSQRLDALANALAEGLRALLDSVFAPDIVVVSGATAEQCVRFAIARRLGVCANVKFVSPSSFISRTLGIALGRTVNRNDAWASDRLVWAILRELPTLASDPHFSSLQFYLGDSGTGSPRLAGLAQRIAECFARYMSHRPELIDAWERSEEIAPNDWQGALWRRVRAHIDMPHQGELARTFVRLVDGNALDRAVLPRRVQWLVQGTTAPLHVELFAALGRAGVDARMYVLSPTRTIRRDSRHSDARATSAWSASAPPPTAHPLAESLGASAWDLEQVLAMAGGESPHERDGFVTVQGSSMLARLQRAILGDASPAPNEAKVDDSVQVHACHGDMRQVEVLHDVLLRLLDSDPTLLPRDILVLSPVMTEFAPLVEAVFGRGGRGSDGGGTPALSCDILDGPGRQGSPLAEVIARLFSLTSGRVGASELLDFIMLAPIANRFGIAASERDRLSAWIHDSGIRWGIDERDRTRYGLPPERANSWRFGFDRLLTGWALSLGEERLWEGVLPYDLAEGDAAALLGRFVEGCEQIFTWIGQLREPHSPSEWGDVLGAIVGFIAEESADELDALSVQRAIDEMVEGAAMAGMTTPLDTGALRMLLAPHLEESRERAFGLRGGVSFASLRPARVIPARVIAILGADSAHFPRQRSSLGFDYLTRDPRVGDPDPGSEDRGAFLAALMSATDRFIVTYAGRSALDNALCPAAAPVDELLEALVDSCNPNAAGSSAGIDDRRNALVREIVREHPLQPFSPRNFAEEGSDAGSYEQDFLHAAQALVDPRCDAPVFLSSSDDEAASDTMCAINLDQLVQFFEHPARALLRERWGLWLEDDDDAVEDTEPVTTSALTGYSIRDRLIRSALDGSTGADVFDVVKATGALPHGLPARFEFSAFTAQGKAIASLVQTMREGAASEALEVSLTLGDVTLQGRIPNRCGDTLLVWRAGQVRDRDVLAAWIRHLAACAMCAQHREALPTTVAIGLDKKKEKATSVRLAPVSNAAVELTRLIELRASGLRAPLPAFPTTSRTLAEFVRTDGATSERWAPNDRLKRQALFKARAAWRSDYDEERVSREGDDVWNMRLYGAWSPGEGDDAMDQRFIDASLAIWLPLLASLEGGAAS